MKKAIITTSTLIALGLTSCTKVVDIDLNSSDPQYVIEGNVTDGDGSQTVHISRSVNFSDDNNFPPVTDAIVIISDGAGVIDTLEQKEPGYYHTNSIVGVPGYTYNMRILVDGQEFTSSSTMPQPVSIEGLDLVDESFFGEETQTPIVSYQDPAGMRNFYRFNIYKNDTKFNTLYLENDFAYDGALTNTSLRALDSTYNSGDNIRIEMQCITSTMYDYYFSLQQTMTQGSATPANPVSNISGTNVLGYFSAHTKQERSIVVP